MTSLDTDSVQKMRRRGFLATLAAGGIATRQGFAAAEPTPGGFKLGVASYSLRKFNRAAAISMIKQLRTPYVNIKEFHLPIRSTPAEVVAGRKEFEDAGLIILGGGNISFQKDDEDDFRHKFEYAKLAGMPVIVCAPTAQTLPKLEKYVKEYNIKLAIHNHGKTDKHFPSPQSVLKAVDGMDPRCGLCIDVGHTAEYGVDVVQSIRESGPRLHDLHIKDLRDMSDAETQVPVGEGRMPVAAIFRELVRMKYGGGVMLEYEADENDPLPGMAKSFAYMRGVLAGMQA
jgi:sugar phosphate isomerase/epimerase